jgi:hypothetical protein
MIGNMIGFSLASGSTSPVSRRAMALTGGF